MIFLTLDAITTIIINKFITSDGIAFWIFNLFIAAIELRLSTSIAQPIKFIRDKGKLCISEETASVQLGKKKYFLKGEDVERIELFPSTISSIIVGGNWDVVLVKTNKEKIKILSHPDEKEEKIDDREIFGFFKKLSSAFELAKEIDDEGNITDYCYVKHEQSESKYN